MRTTHRDRISVLLLAAVIYVSAFVMLVMTAALKVLRTVIFVVVLGWVKIAVRIAEVWETLRPRRPDAD